MKMLYQLLVLVAIAHLVFVGALMTYLLASGRLNADSMDTIAAALRGEELVAQADVKAPAEPVTTTQTTQPASPAHRSTGDRWTDSETQLVLLARQMRTVRDKQTRLNSAMLKLIEEREAFEQQRRQFDKQVAAQQAVSQDEGFKKALTLYSDMPAQQAKTLFMKLDQEVVVRYLMNMPKRSAKKILQEFRTEEELERCRDLLERIRARDAMAEAQIQPDKG